MNLYYIVEVVALLPKSLYYLPGEYYTIDDVNNEPHYLK